MYDSVDDVEKSWSVSSTRPEPEGSFSGWQLMPMQILWKHSISQGYMEHFLRLLQQCWLPSLAQREILRIIKSVPLLNTMEFSGLGEGPVACLSQMNGTTCFICVVILGNNDSQDTFRFISKPKCSLWAQDRTRYHSLLFPIINSPCRLDTHLKRFLANYFLPNSMVLLSSPRFHGFGNNFPYFIIVDVLFVSYVDTIENAFVREGWAG